MYLEGQQLKKIIAIASGYLRRFLILFNVTKYDYVLIHRELTPLGPPVFEWLIAKVLRKKIIFDFDDAIWMNDGHDSGLLWKLKWRSKIASTCKWSWNVTAGNDFLADFAKNYCQQVVFFPTVVNTSIHQMETRQPNPGTTQLPTIGWTGSHSTLFYLDSLLPVLQKLEQEIDFAFLVIANKNPELPLKNFRFIKWKRETEVDDLRKMDIGVMPLEDNEWSKGKCGFKLIQYLSIGVPAVASPIGVNPQIIRDGETGYLSNTPEEWGAYLKKLLADEVLRIQMGKKGMDLIEKEYSVNSQTEKFLSLFQ